jgi:hypothetical protein
MEGVELVLTLPAPADAPRGPRREDAARGIRGTMQRGPDAEAKERSTDGPARVDELYAGFAAALGEPTLAEGARGLAVTLGLAPSREVPWSDVFSHEVTLAAPALLAEAMPFVPRAVVDDATLAHTLAVIEAFGTDRLEDRQVARTPALDAVLARIREARDAALARVLGAGIAGGGAGDAQLSYADAGRRTLAAIRDEQAMLRGGEAVAWARYLDVAWGKQRIGLPASLALAAVAGWDARRRRAVARLLDAVGVGLQLSDDVVDWEEDLARGGAWAALLAAYGPPGGGGPRERQTIPVSIQRLVHVSGVLPHLLARSARQFRVARRLASVLGAARLASWARAQETKMAELGEREQRSPGYANRARALSSWAKLLFK